MNPLEIDKKTFRSLASETRVNILKTLDKRRCTVTELSGFLDLSKSTVHEHLLKLIDSGLVIKNKRDGYKWVYYEITEKGKQIIRNNINKIILLLSFSIVSFVAGIYEFVNYIVGKSILVQPLAKKTAETVIDEAEIVIEETKGVGIIHEPIHLVIGIILIIIGFILFYIGFAEKGIDC